MSQETTFSEIGKIAAIERLYENTPFKAHGDCRLYAPSGAEVLQCSKVLLEGIDFDLVYFPLKHLGYKNVLGATGELYAAMCTPQTLSVILGVSSKLDFAQISELWEGIVTAAKEHSYAQVSLDLVPSNNGLSISLASTGLNTLKISRSTPESKDLLVISGSVGAAYLGMQVLENGRKSFEKGEQPDLEKYRMLVAAYLKPELGCGVVDALQDAGICPSAGVFVTHGLADAVKRITRSSGLGAKIYADKLPFEGNSFELGRELNIDPISAAMNGGDDYRLLYAIPLAHYEKFRHDFQTFDIVGHLAQKEVGATLVTPDGLELPLQAQGW